MNNLENLSKEELIEEVVITQRLLHKLSESLQEKELQIAHLKVQNEVLGEKLQENQ